MDGWRTLIFVWPGQEPMMPGHFRGWSLVLQGVSSHAVLCMLANLSVIVETTHNHHMDDEMLMLTVSVRMTPFFRRFCGMTSHLALYPVLDSLEQCSGGDVCQWWLQCQWPGSGLYCQASWSVYLVTRVVRPSAVWGLHTKSSACLNSSGAGWLLASHERVEEMPKYTCTSLENQDRTGTVAMLNPRTPYNAVTWRETLVGFFVFVLLGFFYSVNNSCINGHSPSCLLWRWMKTHCSPKDLSVLHVMMRNFLVSTVWRITWLTVHFMSVFAPRFFFRLLFCSLVLFCFSVWAQHEVFWVFLSRWFLWAVIVLKFCLICWDFWGVSRCFVCCQRCVQLILLDTFWYGKSFHWHAFSCWLQATFVGRSWFTLLQYKMINGHQKAQRSHNGAYSQVFSHLVKPEGKITRVKCQVSTACWIEYVLSRSLTLLTELISVVEHCTPIEYRHVLLKTCVSHWSSCLWVTCVTITV